MSRIQILPESVKNKIAAGEVVEGPFSVVKELMENSIDAEASEIDVEIFDSGLKKIIVKDNGKGIHKDDLPLAVQNHATSKIRGIADIESISSFGFRGEALASISSISKLTIISRSAEVEIGAKFVSSNEQNDLSDYAGAVGTTIIIENLFYNIPARKKFLKSKSAELRKIRESFLKIALAKPGTGFSFSINEKRIITLTKANTLTERLEQIYGKSAVKNLSFESLKDKAEISGFFSKPDFLKSSRSMQALYVNGRCIEHKYLGFLLSKVYEAIAPKGSHPAAILFINIDPELIDVNIHPAKKEIKFCDQNYINSLIMRLGEKALGKTHSLNIERISAKPAGAAIFSNIDANPATAGFAFNYEAKHPGLIKNTGTYMPEHARKTFIREAEKSYPAMKPSHDFKYLGIIFDTYIIVEHGNDLTFIDFHAAHERSIYNELLNTETRPETQALIFPNVIELSIEDYQIFLEKKDYFDNSAFDVDIFSDKSIVVRGMPCAVKGLDIEGFFADIFEALKNDADHMLDVKKAIAEKAACRSAKRSGDSLTVEDAELIASRALSGDYEKRCPHGRPYMFKLKKNDLEKVFKRI
ncbi:MAG: DNA mismatch repair endonuclease MutL [Spirochaetes bacterium]|nr:DNA mismatch repair endonuclease MutL [Spirochaetota bacterium]